MITNICILILCDKKANALRWNCYACNDLDWHQPQFGSMYNHCKCTAKKQMQMQLIHLYAHIMINTIILQVMAFSQYAIIDKTKKKKYY